MSTKLFTSLSALLVLALTSACSVSNNAKQNVMAQSSADNVKQTRPAGVFSSVDVSRGVLLVYTQSDEVSIEVEAPDNVIDKIFTKIDDGKLKVSVDRSITNINFNAIVRVSAPVVVDFEAGSGAGINVKSLNADGQEVDIEVSSAASVAFAAIKASKLDVETSSGAQASVEGISAIAIDAECSSGSALNLTGTATTGKLDASSGAMLDASGLVINTASAEASSGSTIVCHVKNFTNRKTSSGGSISNN